MVTFCFVLFANVFLHSSVALYWCIEISSAFQHVGNVALELRAYFEHASVTLQHLLYCVDYVHVHHVEYSSGFLSFGWRLSSRESDCCEELSMERRQLLTFSVPQFTSCSKKLCKRRLTTTTGVIYSDQI